MADNFLLSGSSSGFVIYAAFATLCLLLFLLPFIPAYNEWRHPTDIAALPVSANYSSDIDHFARRLRSDAMAKMGRGETTGYEEFDYLQEYAQGQQPTTDVDMRHSTKRLIARDSIRSEHAFYSIKPLFVDGTIDVGSNADFGALYAVGDIVLGSKSHVRDWAHAEGVLRIGSNGSALRRISAGHAVELETGVWFERLHAPSVHFGTTPPVLITVDSANDERNNQLPGNFADLPGAVRQTPVLYLIRGDCVLAPNSLYTKSLIVTGLLTISEGTTVIGDIKARGGIRMENSASVRGAVTCEKTIHLGRQTRAWGPLISETDIFIGSGAVIGLPDALTTVSASNIIAVGGSTVHGTVWAHEIGMVQE